MNNQGTRKELPPCYPRREVSTHTSAHTGTGTGTGTETPGSMNPTGSATAPRNKPELPPSVPLRQVSTHHHYPSAAPGDTIVGAVTAAVASGAACLPRREASANGGTRDKKEGERAPTMPRRLVSTHVSTTAAISTPVALQEQQVTGVMSHQENRKDLPPCFPHREDSTSDMNNSNASGVNHHQPQRSARRPKTTATAIDPNSNNMSVSEISMDAELQASSSTHTSCSENTWGFPTFHTATTSMTAHKRESTGTATTTDSVMEDDPRELTILEEEDDEEEPVSEHQSL